MAGHSKWSNIKNKKAATDAKKGKVFSRLAKLIRVAVKEGKSGDPKQNSSLRLLLDKASSANMPKNKIQRAIDCGLGKGKGANVKEIKYEGYGPDGVALIIVTLTDNVNRTSSEIRFILSKAGGSLGGPGSASFLFKRTSSGEYTPTIPMKLDDNQKKKIEKLLESLRNLDEVEDIYCSAEID